MQDKSTQELEKILNSTHAKEAEKYLLENADNMIDNEKPFVSYMRKILKEKRLRKQDIFIQADIPERYGYKLLSEQKRTKQRDVILRICYASDFTLEETQRALKLYGMSPLYARIPRDAVLMIAFNEHPGSIIEVNAMLKKHGMECLRTSGSQD